MYSYIVAVIIFLVTVPLAVLVSNRLLKLQNLKWWSLLLASAASAITFEAILLIFRAMNYYTESPVGGLMLVVLFTLGMLVVFHLVLKVFIPEIKFNNSIVLLVIICALFAVLAIAISLIAIVAGVRLS